MTYMLPWPVRTLSVTPLHAPGPVLYGPGPYCQARRRIFVHIHFHPSPAGDARRQHLSLAAACAVDRDPLAAQLPRKKVGHAHVLPGGRVGKLMVLEIPASTLSWNAACIRTWSWGDMSAAVTKTSLTHSGTSSSLSWMEPPSARYSISSSL